MKNQIYEYAVIGTGFELKVTVTPTLSMGRLGDNNWK
jgi:hypothetical protein